MITFACSGCGQKLRVNEELAGKQMRCPRCQQVGAIPVATAAASELPTVAAQPPADPLTETPTPAGLASETDPESCKDQVDFLAPPQGPDELGRLGPYRVLKVLGKGGMGVVFLAEDPQLKRTVALKAMLPVLAASDSNRQRFLQEAQTAAALEHDHVIHIYQVGEDRGVPFLAMPFLKGEPLDQCLKREKRLPASEVLRIGREVAEGLAAAHEKGLIHRDIKPANVWLEAPRGRVKILDFGLARAVSGGSHLTQTGAILGTPAYMSPEQARGKAVDGRSDLFSLGCVLYQVCTGQLPFEGSDTISTLMAVSTDDPPSPEELNPEVPPALSDLVMHLLAKSADDRPASAAAVVEAISRIEDDQLEPLADTPRRRPPSKRREDEDDRDDRTRHSAPKRGKGRREINILGVTSLVLGGGALALAWIPIISCFSILLSGLGFLLGLGGIVLAALDRRRGLTSPIAGTVVNVLAFGLVPLSFWLWTRPSGHSTGTTRTITRPTTTVVPRSPAQALIDADRFWATGQHAAAVATYKREYTKRTGAARAELFKRIVEHELRQKNQQEARKWMAKALDEKLQIEYESEAARNLLAELKKEREAGPKQPDKVGP
jgi:serine/threonine protein kinase